NFCINFHVMFFSYPLKRPDVLAQWIRNARRENFTPTASSRLCSLHFEEKYFSKCTNERRRLIETAVPTLFAGHPKHCQIKIPDPEIQARALKRAGAAERNRSFSIERKKRKFSYS